MKCLKKKKKKKQKKYHSEFAKGPGYGTFNKGTSTAGKKYTVRYLIMTNNS